MGQVPHGSATTIRAVRRAIQNVGRRRTSRRWVLRACRSAAIPSDWPAPSSTLIPSLSNDTPGPLARSNG
jgi:hypothetical protein